MAMMGNVKPLPLSNIFHRIRIPLEIWISTKQGWESMDRGYHFFQDQLVAGERGTEIPLCDPPSAPAPPPQDPTLQMLTTFPPLGQKN